MNSKTNLAENLDTPNHLHFFTPIQVDVETTQIPQIADDLALDETRRVFRLKSNSTAASLHYATQSDETKQAWSRFVNTPGDPVDNALLKAPDTQVFSSVKNVQGLASTHMNTIDTGIVRTAEYLHDPDQLDAYNVVFGDVEASQIPLVERDFELDKVTEVFQAQNNSTVAYGIVSMLSDESKQLWPGIVDRSGDLGGIPLNKLRNARIICHLKGSLGFTSNSKYEVDIGILGHEIHGQLEQLFTDARDELFEVGIESQFSKGLQKLCSYDPTTVLQYLRMRLINNDANSEVFAEVLRWASHQKAKAIRDYVIDLLSVGLLNSSSIVRDSAALSLAYLEKTGAVAQLQQAFEREKVMELQKDLEDLIRSLEN